LIAAARPRPIEQGMKGYTARDVARLLDLSIGQVRSYARAGFLHPSRGARGEYRFSFQDLVLLRTAKGLLASRIPPRKIKRALTRLQRELPTGRPLSGVQIVARGDRVLVRSGDALWNPDSGQTQFDFEVAELAEKVRPHAREAVHAAQVSEDELEAEDWFALGSELEAAAPEEARESYRRTLELDPEHVEARVNLGRLLHEAGQLESAAAHYRLALTFEPGNKTALFNLGVAQEDLGAIRTAIETYRRVVKIEPDYADAHHNLARLLERCGDDQAALHHFKIYRRLTLDP